VADRWETSIIDVSSDTGAWLPTGHFSFLVRIQVKLRAGEARRRDAGVWDFKAANDEQTARYDAEVVRAMGRVLEAPSLDEGWSLLSEAVSTALVARIPRKQEKPNRPWIGQETLLMMESRRALGALDRI